MRAAIDDRVAGMREHHQGAVTMSRAYLDAVGKQPHPIMRSLANAIIANQEFEIALLNDVGRHVERAPRQVVFGLVARQTGWSGTHLAVHQVATPGVPRTLVGQDTYTEEEVRFAKGMTRPSLLVVVDHARSGFRLRRDTLPWQAARAKS